MTLTLFQSHLLLSIRLYPGTTAREQNQKTQQMVDAGLLDTKLNLTNKGRAHVAQICALETPVGAWVDTHGKLIQI